MLNTIWKDYDTECKEYQDQYARLLRRGRTAQNPGAIEDSVLGKFLDTLQRAEVEVESARAQVLTARAKYQDALKALKDASALGTPVDVAALDKLVAALQELRQVPIFGRQEALKAQLDSVVALLDDLAKGGGTSTPAQQGNLRIAETVQALNQALQKTREKPTTASLVLTAEHLRLEFDRATRQVRFKEARLSLLHQQGIAFVTELTLLRQALTALKQGPEKGCPQDKALAQSYEVDYAAKPVWCTSDQPA